MIPTGKNINIIGGGGNGGNTSGTTKSEAVTITSNATNFILVLFRVRFINSCDFILCGDFWLAKMVVNCEHLLVKMSWWLFIEFVENQMFDIIKSQCDTLNRRSVYQIIIFYCIVFFAYLFLYYKTSHLRKVQTHLPKLIYVFFIMCKSFFMFKICTWLRLM